MCVCVCVCVCVCRCSAFIYATLSHTHIYTYTHTQLRIHSNIALRTRAAAAAGSSGSQTLQSSASGSSAPPRCSSTESRCRAPPPGRCGPAPAAGRCTRPSPASRAARPMSRSILRRRPTGTPACVGGGRGAVWTANRGGSKRGGREGATVRCGVRTRWPGRRRVQNAPTHPRKRAARRNTINHTRTLTWISAIRSYFMAAFSQSPSSQMVDSLWKSGIAAAEPMTRHRMNFMRAAREGRSLRGRSVGGDDQLVMWKHGRRRGNGGPH